MAVIYSIKFKRYIPVFFDIYKFKKLVLECQREQIIERLRFYTEGGCLGVGVGWSEDNHTIVDINERGVYFNNDESHIYSFDEIAELLIDQYGKAKSY